MDWLEQAYKAYRHLPRGDTDSVAWAKYYKDHPYAYNLVGVWFFTILIPMLPLGIAIALLSTLLPSAGYNAPGAPPKVLKTYYTIQLSKSSFVADYILLDDEANGTTLQDLLNMKCYELPVAEAYINDALIAPDEYDWMYLTPTTHVRIYIE